MQSNFPFLALMQAPRPAPDSVVSRIKSDAEALAVALHGHKQAYIAAQLGVSGAYLSQMKKGERPLPDKFVLPLCYLTGTLLIQQHRELRDALDVMRGRILCAVASMAAEIRRAAA
jgi:DNA-binding transcriptional regulator YdaS (Cro superfamily)